jgi:hypothetical protein
VVRNHAHAEHSEALVLAVAAGSSAQDTVLGSLEIAATAVPRDAHRRDRM